MVQYKFIKSILKSQSLATKFFNKIPEHSVAYLNLLDRFDQQEIKITFE
jgi:hypothetical protein